MRKQSPIFTLNWNDALKGLIMAVLTPALLTIEQTVQNGSLQFNWKAIVTTAIAGFVGYLLKNFFTQSTPTKQVTKTDEGTVTETVIKTDSVNVKVKP